MVLRLHQKPGKDYDAIIVAVAHNEYIGLTDELFQIHFITKTEYSWM